jgi:hypothetical protein
LQGYVEWHIANTIQSIATSNQLEALDIILICLVVLFSIMVVNRLSERKQAVNSVNIILTLTNIFSMIAVNTTAKTLIFVVTTHSSFDIFSSLFILTIAIQSGISFSQKVAQSNVISQA